MIKQLKFTIGGVSNGYKTVEIFIKNNEISYKILRNGLLNVDKKISSVVENSEVRLAELIALKVFAWEKNYSSDVPDGVQWELMLKIGKKISRWRGTNAYPENWEQFLEWLDTLIPELEFVNRKRLEKITINYYKEKLTLDRRERTLTIDKEYSSHVYDLGEDTKEIFKTAQKFFDNPDIEDADINFGSRAKFELIRHDSSVAIFETVYNENFLPGLTNFIEEVHALADDLTAEIFSPAPAEVVPRQGKYILCKVQFKTSYKHYTYRTDDETLAIGDVVDVPVGRNNDVNQARVVEIGYFDEYETPYPIERIKAIIGKHICEEWENN